MPGLEASIKITARTRVIPGPVTRQLRAGAGEFWCECHGWHRHDGPDPVACPAEPAP